MTDTPVFELRRLFAAPPALVWRSWTDPALLARWYGPNVETIIHGLDVRPGGLWLNEMKMGGRSNFQRTEYLEVIEPRRLVCLMSEANSDWTVSASSMMPDWPRTLLTTVTFEARDDNTEMHLTWSPHGATTAEIACFRAAINGLGKGWGAGMDALDQLLAELQG